jgi:hypothetical protein
LAKNGAIVATVPRTRVLLVAGWLVGAALGCRERVVPPAAKERAMPNEVSIVEIEADAAALAIVRRTPGVVVEDHGQQPLGGGRFRVAARVTDDGLARLRAAGLSVRVVQSAAELRRHFEELDRDGKRDGGS